MTAAACIVIANKFFERDDSAQTGTISDIVRTINISRRQLNQGAERSLQQPALTYDQVCKREVEILRLLEWNINVVTPYSFITNYLCQGIVLSTDKMSLRGVGDDDPTGSEPQITTVFR